MFFLGRSRRRNASRGTNVYNQCSNRILRQAILLHQNKELDELKSVEERELPAPPVPGDVDCIVTGAPWYIPSTSLIWPVKE